MSEAKQESTDIADTELQPRAPEVIDIVVTLPSCVVTKSKLVTIPSTINATLGELKQTLSLIHVLRNFTNYDIYHQGINFTSQFDDLFEMDAIFDQLSISLQPASASTNELEQERKRFVVLNLHQKPYTLSSVYQHLIKFRESVGLNFLDKNSYSHGTLDGVCKFNEIQLAEIKAKQTESDAGADSDATDKPAVELSEQDRQTLSEIAALFSAPQPPLSTHGSFKTPFANLKLPLKALSLSHWSPVPASRRLRGDLLYLTVQTLENDTFNITCHVSGFFVNSCSFATFNPSLKVSEGGVSNKHYNLFDLISSLSSLFGRTIGENDAQLFAFSPNYPEAYMTAQNAFLASPWCINPQSFKASVKPDGLRALLSLLANGVDGVSNVKDWNEDIQSIRELPKSNIDARILREQLLAKSLFEFSKTATDTAISIIHGDVPSINPQDLPERNVYLRNGIFYFMNVNDSGAFDLSGGDEAARYTSSKDLASARILTKHDPQGISVLVSCIVDYMGKRVVCQAPVPGIFNNPPVADGGEDEQDSIDNNKVSYGLGVDRANVYEDEDFATALQPMAEAFHLKAHPVASLDGVASKGDLVISQESKGIQGTDGRKYVIDLYRSTPLDIEFIESHWNDAGELSYPHRETVLRHEAVEEWWKRKVSVLIKEETEKLEKGAAPAGKGEEKPQLVIPSDLIVFNPDAFGLSNSANHDDDEEVREMSKFITRQLIPDFLTETATKIAPFDGDHLSKSLHQKGINLRYLGHIAVAAREKKEAEQESLAQTELANRELLAAKRAEKSKESEAQSDTKGEDKDASEKAEDNKVPESSLGKFESVVANLATLEQVAEREMIARASKHILRTLSRGLPIYLVLYLVAHFHNCLLGSGVTTSPECRIDPEMAAMFNERDLRFTKLTSEDVFDLISKEVYVRFRYHLSQNWHTAIKPTQLLREIALKYGIQWKAQQYAYTAKDLDKLKVADTPVEIRATTKSKKKNGGKRNAKSASPALSNGDVARRSTFVAEDIISFTPVVKGSTHKSLLLSEVFEAARVHIYKGETEIGLTLLNELIAFYDQIYGTIHPETSRFYSSLAQIYSELDMTTEACRFARKACIMNERTFGVDSFETVLAYINASFYEGLNDDSVSSIKLYSRVISDWGLIYGDDHPSSVNTITNLAETLSGHQLYDESHKLFDRVLQLSDRLNGDKSQVSAMIRYRYARSIFAAGKIEEALHQFKSANEIFGLSISPDDIFTKETDELVSKFEDHILYTSQEKKNQIAQQAQMAVQQAALAKTALNAATKKNTGGKKAQHAPKPDPSIASQSVDEILKFINGSSSAKKSKKTKKKN
jgi:protein TIF31